MFGVQMIGNVHAYAKTMQMKSQWQQKQQSGNFTDKRDPVTGALVEEQKSVVDLLSVDQPQERSLDDQNKLKEIRNKLQLGSSLTKEDLEYLKKNDPELYEEYVRAEEERKQAEKSYKEALKRCKTQQEVERLKTSALHQSMARAKFIANNPHIPDEKKAVLIGAEKGKTDDVARTTREFVRKGEYARLPTEAEVIRAMKEDAEDQRERLGVPEKDAGRESEKATVPEKKVRPEELPSEKPTEADQRKKVEPHRTGRQEYEVKVESEAQRKVRRAKARAAYAFSHGDKEDPAWKAQG